MLAVTLFMATLFSGCNKEEVEFEHPDISINPSVITSSGTETTFDVISNRPWKVVIPDEVTWVVASPSEGVGNGKVTLMMLENVGAPREADIRVETSTVYAVAKLTQKGSFEITNLLNVTFGMPAGTTKIPDYTGWDATGAGASTVKFAGTNSDIRSTNPSDDSKNDGKYQGSSGAGNVFFGQVPATFTISDISVGTATDFILHFGSFKFASGGDNSFNKDDMKVEYSADAGATWSDITYDRTTYSKWALVKTTFSATPTNGKVWLKFTVSNTASQYRIDDVNLMARGVIDVPTVPVVTTGAASDIATETAKLAGSYVYTSAAGITEVGVAYIKTADLASGTFTEAKVAGGIASPFSVPLTGLTENCDYTYKAYVKMGTNVYYGENKTFKTLSSNAPTRMFGMTFGKPGGTTAISNYTDWGASGQSSPTVSYSGTGDIRISSPSAATDYEGASGEGNAYMSAAGAYFEIADLNVNTGQAANYYIKLGNRIYSGAYDNTKMTIQISEDGGTWRTVDHTRSESINVWRIATSSEFAVSQTTKKLGIKFICNEGGIQLRLDDIELFCTTPGITVTEVPILKTEPLKPADITNTSVSISGSTSYSGTLTERGIAYKKVSDATFTNAPATGLDGAFTVTISSLTEGTSYVYKPYAIVGSETYDGVEGIFATTGGTPTAISTLKGLPDGEVTTIAKIRGTVVSNAATINIDPKSVAIQDSQNPNSGIIIRVAASPHLFALGDEIDVITAGGTLSTFNGIRQFTPTGDDMISKTNTTTTPSAKTITVTELKSGDYESMYVEIAGSQVVNALPDMKMNGGLTSGYKNTQMEVDGSPVENYMMTVKASSPPATFGGEIVPQLNGTLKGIAAYSPSDGHQIMPQSLTDFQGWTGTRFGALSFGTPTFTGTLTEGTAIAAGAKISIPYFNANADVLTVSVAVAGTGAPGIAEITNQDFTLNRGGGSLDIPITGTPTTVGDVTFTISGIAGLTVTTVNATVAPAPIGGESVIYSTDFESADGFASGTAYNNPTPVVQGTAPYQWSTIYGTTTTTDASPNGTLCMQMRWYTNAATTLGNTSTTFNLSNVTKVDFQAKNTLGLNVTVSYSTDDGNTWIGDQTFTLTGTFKDYSYSLNNGTTVPSARIRFMISLPATNPTSTARMIIDSVKVYGVN